MKREHFLGPLGLLLLLAACNLGTPIGGGGGTGGEGLTGTLVDTRGVRLAGTTVRVYPDSAMLLPKAGAAASPESTVTSGDGTYRFSGLAAGRYSLHASIRRGDTVSAVFVRGIDYAQSFHLGTDTLRPSGSLHVRVRNAVYDPVAGAYCRIPGSPWGVFSDIFGDCDLTGVAPGDYRVLVTGYGLSAWTDTLKVRSGQSTNGGELSLLPAGQIPHVAPGVYETIFDSVGVYRVRLQLRADSTYTQETRLTNADSGWTGMLTYEQSGRYRVGEGRLWKTNVMERVIGTRAGVGRWVTAAAGPQNMPSIRSITSGSFQILGKEWVSWYRIPDAADLKEWSEPLFSHPRLGFSLRIPLAGWNATLDTLISTTVYDVLVKGPAIGGFSANVIAYRIVRSSGKSLQTLMEETRQSVQTQFGAAILGSGIRSRGVAQVAEITYTWTSDLTPVKQKLILLEEGASVVVVQFTDATAHFDVNTDLQAIDSSMAFF